MERVHPTKSHLIKTVREMLMKQSLPTITIGKVLEQAAATKGSLYYHFVDFPDLLEQAVLGLAREKFLRPIETLASIFRAHVEPESVLAEIHHLLTNSYCVEFYAESLVMAKYFSLSLPRSEPAVKKVMAEELEIWEEIYSQARSQGWSTANPPRRIATLLFHSIRTLGYRPSASDHRPGDECCTTVLYLIRTIFFDARPDLFPDVISA